MSAYKDVPAPTSRRMAIIGMAGRFPGAADIDEFWRNLVHGVESLTELQPERLREAGISESRIADPNHVRLAPLMDDIEGFDAKYFGYHAREAQVADPQQRIFLEVCHTALEHAGYDPERYAGSIGVYGGGAPNTYSDRYVYGNDKARAAVGDLGIEINNASDYVATRVAFALGLTGPAVSVTTACSTALVAVHLACQALAGGECTMALAGAVNVRTPYYKGHLWAEDSIYSRDGHVRSFDADASGTNFGYGAGTVVLKRFEDAVTDGDTIYAVIIGSAINNDGAKRASFSAPGEAGQTAVITQALRAAGGISPDSIGYVEAHGTGTAVGDPIEVAALAAAYRQAGATASQSIPIGSVKSNIGHLGAAAGVPALIKTVLAMRHRRLPATLHYRKANPRINFAETPFHVNKGPRSWPKTDGPMRAGVSSFGIGGTNAHVILEEPPAPEPMDPGRPWQVLPLSAKSATALVTLRARLVEHLKANPDAALADVAYTLQVGRPQLAHRTFVACRDGESAAAGLASSEGVLVKPRQDTPVAFMFPGQGSQYIDMAEEVYRTEAVFRDTVDECARLAEPHLGCDVRDVVFSSRSPGTDAEDLAERLRRTEFAQPALFVVEYALARLWMSWGVEPAAMVGHSIGEIVAACLADVFSLSAAIEFVATRGRLTQSMPAGSMLALPLAESEVELVLTGEISLAAVNAPRATVVAGPHDAISALTGLLEPSGVQGTLLRTSHAFHSAMLDPVVAPLREAAERAGLKPPTRRFVSTVTGEWITDEQATDPEYWAAQVRRPVQFAKAVQTAAAAGAVLLEVGPGRSLTSLAKQTLAKSANAVPSLGRPSGDAPAQDGQSLAQAIGQLWAGGVAVDWAALNQGQRRRRVPLPAYPYERVRHWVDLEAIPQAAVAPEAAVSDAADGITYLPVWRQKRLAPPAADAAGGGPLLVFTRSDGPVEVAAAKWAERGQAVVRVLAGDGFADLGDGCFQVAPASRGDYDQLIKALDAGVGRPATVLHGWTATPASDTAFDTAEVHAVRDAGFYSILFLTQAFTTRWPGTDVTLRIVTTQGANVSGADAVEPAKALLQGPGKVVPIELNQVACQLIDLSPTTGADQLLSELAAPIVDRTVAYRGGRRWVADYERTTALAEPVAIPRALRRRGVYLVTGGLGDIGLRIARELARSVGARLILTGRTELPGRAEWDGYLAANRDDKVSASIRAVRDLEGLGSEILTVSADVADEPAMRVAVDAARERFGRIDGVFHAAGIAGAGLVAMKGRDQAESVLRPKVDGTLVLDRLLREEIDLFVLFSSIFAVTGGYGQVDYCAGNAFMDAFAQARSGGRIQVLAVDWCGWSGVGMLDEDPQALAEPSASPGSLGPEPVPSEVRLGDKAPGLLGHRVLDTDDVIFSAIVGPDWHWVLTDHQMSGQQVFPGTSYTEMIAAAARAAFGGSAVELRDLMFSRPLAITGPREMRVAGVRQGSGAYQFTVTSRPLETANAPWERHAGATAAAYQGEEPPWQDVAAIAKRCDVMSWKPDLADPESVVVFGPHWQVVQSVALGRDEQFARLELPAGLDVDMAEYALHPSLLDGATALSLYIPEVVQDGRSYLPIAYDRIIVRDALPTRFYSHIRNRSGAPSSGIMSFDVSLLDDDGRELVSIEGFSVRVIDVETVHAGLDSAPEPSARRSAQTLGLARDELLLDPDLGLDLLWRMLNTRQEAQYVVTIEPIADKIKRLAGLADQVAAVISSARGGAFVGTAAVRAAPAARADAEPATPTEKLLLPLWQDAFAVSRLGLDEDFFDLGGNSLVAVQLSVRIREQFAVNMPGVAVLEYPTVRTLAAFVDATLAEAAQS